MPRPIPEWKASRNAALKAWRDSLAPETRAEMDAAWAAAKANAAARKAAMAERTRLLVSLSLDGLSADEIAAKIGADKRETRRRCAALGIPPAKGGKSPMRRIPGGWIAAETREAIDAMAAECGVGAAEIVERVLTYLFEDGAPKARHLLRHDLPRRAA
jgi:hypothetical protein